MLSWVSISNRTTGDYHQTMLVQDVASVVLESWASPWDSMLLDLHRTPSRWLVLLLIFRKRTSPPDANNCFPWFNTCSMLNLSNDRCSCGTQLSAQSALDSTSDSNFPGVHSGTLVRIASIACPAATLVSHFLLFRYIPAYNGLWLCAHAVIFCITLLKRLCRS